MLRLSQLGYFTIETILLLNPDNNEAEFSEYEDGNGTAKILKGQQLHLMRCRCHLLERFISGDKECDIYSWQPCDIALYVCRSAGVDKKALEIRYKQHRILQLTSSESTASPVHPLAPSASAAAPVPLTTRGRDGILNLSTCLINLLK